MDKNISNLKEQIEEISEAMNVVQPSVASIPELKTEDLKKPDNADADWGKIRSTTRKEIPHGVWDQCKNCEETIFIKQRQENLNVCPKCGMHYPMSAPERIALLTDEGSFKELDAALMAYDVLEFRGVDSYVTKLESNRIKTGMKDAVITGDAELDGIPYALGVMDFRFLGASMGSVVGEKLTRLTEYATAHKRPLVIVTASGGARMYEGILSLMQMAKTSAALKRHQQARLPYIVIMTNPTYAGVTASFASLGDLILAEPGAMIGFAGPRVIKDTTQSQLPDGFQSSEFLLKKGLIDRIIPREDLRRELSFCLSVLTSHLQQEPEAKTSEKAPAAKQTKAGKRAATDTQKEKSAPKRKTVGQATTSKGKSGRLRK